MASESVRIEWTGRGGYSGAAGLALAAHEFIHIHEGETKEVPKAAADYLLDTFPRECRVAGESEKIAPAYRTAVPKGVKGKA